jgi:hypothetical protein
LPVVPDCRHRILKACGGCNAVQYWLCTLCCGCLSPLTVVSRSVSPSRWRKSLAGRSQSESSSPSLVVFQKSESLSPIRTAIVNRSSLSPCRPGSRSNVSATSWCCYLQPQKAHAQLARPHQTSCLNGMELSTGVGWFTYVIISSDVAHSFSLSYSLVRAHWSSYRFVVSFAGRNFSLSPSPATHVSCHTIAAGRHPHPLRLYILPR